MPELSPTDAAHLLEAGARLLRAELALLPPPLTTYHPAPGEWCAKEIVGHLLEAEQRGFAGRIRTMLASPSPELVPWDQDAVARERRDCERNLDELLVEVLRLREASVTLVAGLRDADLARGGQHPRVGWLTVRDIVHEWVHHDRNHVRQILANVQAYVWPAMGNTRKFSGE